MRRKIVIVMLITMIITETIILHNQNTEIRKINNNLLTQLEENKLVIDDEISLETVKKEKDSLKEETRLMFKKENAEDLFEKQRQIGKTLNQEIAILESKIVGLESEISTLEQEYSKLLKEYEKKNSYYINNFPFINQYPNYPTGCESVSLTMLLQYHGINVTPDDIISELPKGSVPYTKNGVIYGANPEVEFVGNPYSLNSYGVYEKPIAEVANKFKSGIIIATGTSFDEILEIVNKGKPVLVWTSMYLAVPYISTSWIYEPTGERVYWKANEHAVVIIGYTRDKVVIADPLG